MNFQEVKNKYPLAYKKFIKQFSDMKLYVEITDQGNLILSDDEGLNVYYYERYLRDLYDFFDEQGIHIEITAYYYHELFYEWTICKIKDKALKVEYYKNKFNTRQQAEEKAFIKSFEILNEKLKSCKKNDFNH